MLILSFYTEGILGRYTSYKGVVDKTSTPCALTRGLAVMRPACHLDTQNTVFDSLDTQNFMSEFAEDDFS